MLVGDIEVRRGIYLIKSYNVKILWNNKDDIKVVGSGSSFNNATNAILKP